MTSNSCSGGARRSTPLPALLAIAVTYALCMPAHAQSTDGKDVEKTLDAVTVTGSHLAPTSAAMQGPTPVRVIDSVQLEKIGATTVYEALRTEPVFAGYADNDTRAGAGGFNGVNLRGLGAEYTLVLLNGRRIASADLNQVPFTAVERIEIVKDGASAIYGSDAITGVVNVILKQNYEGFEVEAGYGNTTHFADGMRAHASFLTGIKTDRGSFLMSGQVEKHNSIVSLEHPLGRSDDQRPWGGPDQRANRMNPGLITLGSGSQVMLNPSFGNGQTGTAASDYVAPYFLALEKRQPNNLQNAKEAATFYGNGRYNLVDDRVQLFADVMHKKVNIDYIDHRGTYLNYLVPATNYWNPFGEDVRVNYLLDYGTSAGRFERPLETMTSDISTTMITVGARGSFDAFDYEIAYSDYKIVDIQGHNGLSKAGIAAQLARTDAGALNLFGNAAVTAAQLDPARAHFERRFENYTRSLTGLVRFSPFEFSAGQVQAAAGFEVRKLGYRSILDESLNRFADSGALTFLNDFSGGADRDVKALFVETNIPLARGLELGLAGRYEKFSDFGSASVPRATLRWEPFADGSLMFRASYSKSFFAPAVGDLQDTGDVNTDPYFDPAIVDANGDPLYYNMDTMSGGNPDLQPTTGKYYNLGMVYSPSWFEGFTISLDAFQLAQRDAFIWPSTQNILDGVSPGVVERSTTLTPGDLYSGAPVGRVIRVINRPVNAATRDVAGIDVNFNYKLATESFGQWDFALYNTFTTKFEYDQIDGDGPQDALGNLLYDGIPKYRGKFQVSNQFGAWTTTLGTNYYGKLVNNYNNDQVIDPYITSDLTVIYDFNEGGAAGNGFLSGTTLSLNVTNVFDQDPPRYVGWVHRGIYSDYSHVDQVGQFVSLTYRKKF